MFAQQQWMMYYEQMLKENDVQKLQGIVVLLEGAIFSRQQELAEARNNIGREELHRMREAENAMLNVKVDKLGFPDFRSRARSLKATQ